MTAAQLARPVARGRGRPPLAWAGERSDGWGRGKRDQSLGRRRGAGSAASASPARLRGRRVRTTCPRLPQPGPEPAAAPEAGQAASGRSQAGQQLGAEAALASVRSAPQEVRRVLGSRRDCRIGVWPSRVVLRVVPCSVRATRFRVGWLRRSRSGPSIRGFRRFGDRTRGSLPGRWSGMFQRVGRFAGLRAGPSTRWLRSGAVRT